MMLRRSAYPIKGLIAGLGLGALAAALIRMLSEVFASLSSETIGIFERIADVFSGSFLASLISLFGAGIGYYLGNRSQNSYSDE